MPTQQPTPAAAPSPSLPEPVAAPETLQDPAAGGHYVRDPVTGVLSPNPVFHASPAQPE